MRWTIFAVTFALALIVDQLRFAANTAMTRSKPFTDGSRE
jgi:hypothetical protein